MALLKDLIVTGNSRLLNTLYCDNIIGTVSKASALTSVSIGSATLPVYFNANGVPVACTYSLNKTVPSDAKFTDTTYSNGTGLSLSGTTFNHSNSVAAVTTATFYKIKYDAQGHITGTTAVAKSDITALGIPGSDTNTTYTLATGDSNGQIKVTPSSGSAYNVSVKGLGSAAYTESSAYAPSSHTHSYLPLSGGIITDGIVAFDNRGLPTFNGTRVDASTTAIGKNGIAIGGVDTSNDGGAIFMENAGTETNHLIIAMGDDAVSGTSVDYIGFRYYDTSGNITYLTKIPSKTGTLAITDDITWTNVTGKPSTFPPDSHTHSYAGSSSAGGAANSANKLNTDAGGSTTPVYFSNGIPVACTAYANASVNYANSAGSAPASDVYSWAKASTKPSYTHNEIGAGNLTIGEGANTLFFRTNSSYVSGMYYHTTGNEAMVFANKNSVTSWIFANTDPSSRTDWTTLSPALLIKGTSVYVHKAIANGESPKYNFLVNGTSYLGGITVQGNHKAYQVASYRTTSTPTKTIIKTKIKFAASNYMLQVAIRGSAYGRSTPIDLEIFFYIYGTEFCNYSYISRGGWKPTNIYLYTYTENSIKYIAIGLNGGDYYMGYDVDLSAYTMSQLEHDAISLSGWSINDTDTIPSVGTNDCKEVYLASLASKIDYATTAGSAPASDVSAWAKASTKPSYTYSEVGAAASSHTHSYAGSSSAGGAATSANKLNTNAGSSTQPVYFSGGVPVACTSYANASVNYANSAGAVSWANVTNKNIESWTFTLASGSTVTKNVALQ